MLGANLGIGSSLDVMDGNDACNRLGDTISGGAALSLMCEVASAAGCRNLGRPFHVPFDFGSYSEGDVVPWAFGIPELPPLALHLLAHATPETEACSARRPQVRRPPANTSRLTVTNDPIDRSRKGLDLPAWDPRSKRGN